MKKFKNKNAITLVALVITIIIMLLLAVVAIQMAIGENDLIAKATQAKTQQAKAELYDIAKLEYLKLRTKAIVTNKESPKVEAVLTEPDFLNKYNIVGDNITNKNNEFIETKENLLKFLREDTSLSPSTPSTPSTPPSPSIPSPPLLDQPYPVATEDKDKLILRYTYSNNTVVDRVSVNKSKFSGLIDWGDGTIDANPSHNYTDNKTERIIKILNCSSISNIEKHFSNWEIELLNIGNAGKNTNKLNIAVSKISCKIPSHIQSVKFAHSTFSNVPKYLLEDATGINDISEMFAWSNITTLPEGFFKNLVNRENITNTNQLFLNSSIETVPEDLLSYFPNLYSVDWLFRGCEKLKSIPNNLFASNPKLTNFECCFASCSSLTSVPKGLFDNNPKASIFTFLFSYCYNLSSIPDGLFKNCQMISNLGNAFEHTKITHLPKDLFGPKITVMNYKPFQSTKLKTIDKDCFRSATNLEELYFFFAEQDELEEIPSDLFSNNLKLKKISGIFSLCTKLKYIPEDLFKNNSKLTNIDYAFNSCTSLTQIPSNLFSSINELIWAGAVFRNCSNIQHIPQTIIDKILNIWSPNQAFQGCTNADNYSTIPAKLK